MFMKYLAYCFLISLYALFVWCGKAPAEGFIVVLTGVISQLGAAHIHAQAAKAAAAAYPPPPPPPIAAPTVVTTQ